MEGGAGRENLFKNTISNTNHEAHGCHESIKGTDLNYVTG